MSSRLLILAIIVLVASVSAPAQSHEAKVNVFSVRVGDKVIIIPPPEGFEEATTQFEQVKTRFTATEAPQNDMLAAHLSVDDCKLLRSGQNALFAQYTKVSVLRAARDLSITAPMFASIVADFRKNSSAYLDMNSPQMQEMFKQWDRELSKLDAKDTKTALSEPQNLGEFDNRANVYSVMLRMELNRASGSEQAKIPMLAGVTYLKVKDKVIFVYTYRPYRERTDVEKLREFSIKWNNSILAAN